MKKLLSLLLILALTLCVFGCARKDTDDDAVIVDNTEQQNENETQNEQQQEQVSDKKQEKPEQSKEQKQPEKEQNQQQTQQSEQKQEQQTEKTPVSVPDYKSFSCRSSKNMQWKQVRFTNDKDITLHFEIPADWELSGQKGEYTITRGGNTIGTLSQQAPQSPKGFYEYSSDYIKEQLVLRTYRVSWYHNSGTDTVNRVFEFHTDQGIKNIQMYLSISYTELDNAASEKLLGSALTVPKQIKNEFPDISQTNGSKKILLLGNSFINSSRINMILDDMLSGTGYSLTGIGRGYAEVMTYAADATVCEQIQRGDYAYVFLCGFYTDGNVEATKTILNCCNASNTKLIMFPAHNEEQNVIDTTFYTYDGITLLDWKGELDSLIENGIDKWDLCVNDTYQHSTQFAGYVGAHMIYRSIFGKVPPKLSSASPVSQAQVDAVLHDYANSMHTPEVPEQLIFNGTEYKI